LDDRVVIRIGLEDQLDRGLLVMFEMFVCHLRCYDQIKFDLTRFGAIVKNANIKAE
jgi:hypothetical protein